jgi:hypothetical protein
MRFILLKTLSVPFMILGSVLYASSPTAPLQETLAPLNGKPAPQTPEALWKEFDPRSEPLDVEILQELEEEDVILRVVRYRVGVFKGSKAMMAGIYGFPKGASDLPGLLQAHGGGQYADYRAVLSNAKRGYATLSIAWAGRINAPDYHVNPDIVKLFWAGETQNPDYRVTTDWGALDAYHHPCRNEKNDFHRTDPADFTLDPVPSPRNNPWFLCVLGARRGLTFLERQPEVDGDRLGVYGHSMGGKITVMTAATDNRVQAAVPSCGGLSDLTLRHGDLYHATISDHRYHGGIVCPILFLSPGNDFHGRIEHLPPALERVQSPTWRIVSAAHHNHQDQPESEAATPLWFDQILKKRFEWPASPAVTLSLNTEEESVTARVEPDSAGKIQSVDVFYTQQGEVAAEHRFWHHAAPSSAGLAQLENVDRTRPLWVYANVQYALELPVSGAGYYYQVYTTEHFLLSSPLIQVSPQELANTGLPAAVRPTLLIEDFGPDWEKEWFSYLRKPEVWERKTRKMKDPRYAAPPNAKLALDVRSTASTTLTIGLDKRTATRELSGTGEWETLEFGPGAFTSKDQTPIEKWSDAGEFRLSYPGSPERDVQTVTFRNLRWSP